MGSVGRDRSCALGGWFVNVCGIHGVTDHVHLPSAGKLDQPAPAARTG
jgi:hypothetical protein